MNNLRRHDNTPEEDALFAFGDDPTAIPTNDLERTVRRLQRASGVDKATASSSIPTDLKHQIWEDLMHARTVPANPLTPVAQQHPGRAAELVSAWSHTAPSRHTHGSPIVRAVMRWQPAVSLAIVVTFLVGLIGIAYQRGVLVEPMEPNSSGLASQVLYDPDDPSTFPRLPDECVANAEVTPDEELAMKTLADWPEPQYGPVQAVAHEQGLAVQETFLRFLRCEMTAFGDATPEAAAWAIPPVVVTPTLLTYFSDRMRFDRLHSTLTPSQQAELDTYRCLPRITEILNTFPMPVNQPVDIAMPPMTAGDELRYTSPLFAPSDVYLLPDGRYGAVVGSMSTAALSDPNAVTSNDFSRFFAFVEVEGRYYIDELFTIMDPELGRPTVNDRNGSISTACD